MALFMAFLQSLGSKPLPELLYFILEAVYPGTHRPEFQVIDIIPAKEV